jgi:hypothetical protein
MNAIAILCDQVQLKPVFEIVSEKFSEEDVHILDTRAYLADFFEGLVIDPIPYGEILDKVYNICRERFPTIWVDCVMHDFREIAHANHDAKFIILGVDKKEEGDYFSELSGFPVLMLSFDDDLSKLEDKIRSNLKDGGEDGNRSTIKFLS